MSDQVIRYPYLVTPAAPVPSEMSSPSPSLSPSTLVGDIDMEATSTTSDSKLQSAPTYIALDTNILIYHLRLVKQVYAVLNALSPVTHHLLIPSIVINELDKLKLSHDTAGSTPAGDVTLGDLAKAATRWLLDTIRAVRQSGQGALKYQRWSEILRQDRHKGDDQILDCCLYFKENQRGANVILWTNDHNLSLLAETNDVQSIGGLAIRLETILKLCIVPIDPKHLQRLNLDDVQISILDDIPQDNEMELDDDPSDSSSGSGSQIYPHSSFPLRRSPLRSSSSLPSSQYDNSSRFAHTTTTTTTMTIPSRPTPSTPIPRPLTDRLTTILRLAYTTISPNTTPPDALPRLLQDMIDSLHAAAKSYAGVGHNETNIDLLRSISAARTILAYIDTHSASRRPRIGQVVDELELLSGLLFSLGIIDARDELRSIAQELKKL